MSGKSTHYLQRLGHVAVVSLALEGRTIRLEVVGIILYISRPYPLVRGRGHLYCWAFTVIAGRTNSCKLYHSFQTVKEAVAFLFAGFC